MLRTAEGNLPTDQEFRVVMGRGERPYALSVIATTDPVLIRIGNAETITVPAGTTFGLGANELEAFGGDCGGEVVFQMASGGGDVDSRYLLLYGRAD